MHHMNTPTYPGAMTPAQLVKRILLQAACTLTTAAAVALFATMFVLFN